MTADPDSEPSFTGGGRGEIRRDARGIPHLWAQDADSLAYLQGRVTALDRAWQVEVERRRGEGTLAEATGRDAVPWDMFARSAGLDALARRAYAACSAPTRRWLGAYAAGVRSGLGAGAAAAPEFGAAPVGPGRWEPWTPLGVFLVQHVLFSTFPHKLWREHVATAFGPVAGRASDARAADAVRILGLDGDDPFGAGSNAWGVPGSSTVSGLPLLAGDPHRLIEAPGIYQQVRLACPEFDVAGLSFPGLPGVQHFGHTGSVAWAVTHAMADYQDLYVERLRRDGERVLSHEPDGTWVGAEVRSEWIRVAGSDPVPVEIVRTARGPVVCGGPDGVGPDGVGPDGVGRGLSLRTPSDVLGDLGFDALPALLRARTVKDVVAAFDAWVEPVNSVLVADTAPPHGTLRSFVAGRVPRRDRRAMLLPVEPADPAATWHGWLPLPDADAPEPVVAANERRPGDTAELGVSFAPGHRGRRIAALVERALEDGGGRLSADALAAIHADTYLGAVTTARTAWRGLDPETLRPRARAVLEGLLGWDGRMDAVSPGAALFARWRAAFVRRAAGDPALGPLHAVPPYPELFAPWLDVTARIGHAWESLLRSGSRLGLDVESAVRGAVDDVASEEGPPSGLVAATPWSRLHLLAPLRVEPPGSAGWPVPETGLGGDADCVLATSSVPGVTHRVSRGPVARYVWDLSDASRGGWVVPLGSSGVPGDPHALDQLPDWAAGRLAPVVPADGEFVVAETDVVPWSGGPLDPPACGEAHRRDLGGVVLTLTVLDPATECGLVHGWASQERARFWGLTEATAEDVRRAYDVVDGLVTHHAFVIRVDDEPVGLLQTYRPEYDPVGEVYAVRPGDAGVHLLLAPGKGATRWREAVFGALRDFLFVDPRVLRVVAEPDARNRAALARLIGLRFTLGPEVALPGKTARLAFLDRPTSPT